MGPEAAELPLGVHVCEPVMGDAGTFESSACVPQELLVYKEQVVRVADIVNSQPVLGGDTEWQKDPHKEEASAVSTFCTRGAPPPWPSPALPGPALPTGQ